MYAKDIDKVFARQCKQCANNDYDKKQDKRQNQGNVASHTGSTYRNCKNANKKKMWVLC